MPQIKQGLEKKLDAMVMRRLYIQNKTAPTEERKEKARRNIWIDEVCRRAFGGSFS